MDGVLVIDKPAGPTSHDVVNIVRRITGAKKVGHLGTLDPKATGVLPLAINAATKRAKDLAGTEKIYEFTLKLGVRTTTDDDAGKILEERTIPPDAHERIEALIPQFIGMIMQRPPDYSAICVGGERAYRVACRGDEVKIAARPVQIDSLTLLTWDGSSARMRVECRSGTYVRSLCRDLGEAIGSGGHAAEIRRLKSGAYIIDTAIPLIELTEKPSIWSERLIPLNTTQQIERSADKYSNNGGG